MTSQEHQSIDVSCSLPVDGILWYRLWLMEGAGMLAGG